MAAVHKRIVLGCLFACLLSVPALATDTATAADEAYGALKERLVEQVDRGLVTVPAMESFLERLQERSSDLAAIRLKDARASEEQVRVIFREVDLTGPEAEREDLLKAVVRWVDLNQVREASIPHRSRELRRQ